MNRIEEFTHDGKSFVYLDLSNFKTNDEFARLIEASKPVIRKYEGRPLYTITNVKDLRFDTKTKRLVAEWMAHNKPYVKYGAVIGVDSIKQLMLNSVFAICGRKNMHTSSTKEEAVQWLLMQPPR
jgi:hypothetical protein